LGEHGFGALDHPQPILDKHLSASRYFGLPAFSATYMPRARRLKSGEGRAKSDGGAWGAGEVIFS
ncbi:MAG: hypothetical protein M0Z90_09795, partial [Desulfobacteraceae bacterium]|nr:hypothetical protein [Desulfobacteraceae bacterium]